MFLSAVGSTTGGGLLWGRPGGGADLTSPRGGGEESPLTGGLTALYPHMDMLSAAAADFKRSQMSPLLVSADLLYPAVIPLPGTLGPSGPPHAHPAAATGSSPPGSPPSTRPSPGSPPHKAHVAAITRSQDLKFGIDRILGGSGSGGRNGSKDAARPAAVSASTTPPTPPAAALHPAFRRPYLPSPRGAGASSPPPAHHKAAPPPTTGAGTCPCPSPACTHSRALFCAGLAGFLPPTSRPLPPPPPPGAMRLPPPPAHHHHPHPGLYVSARDMHNAFHREHYPGPYSSLGSGADRSSPPGGAGASPAKRKRSWSRAVFSALQRKGLEKRFEVQKYVTKPDRRQLAAMLGLTDAQVKVWFQNRRMKWRHAEEQKKRRSSSSEAAPAPTAADGADSKTDAAAKDQKPGSVEDEEAKMMMEDEEEDDEDELVEIEVDIGSDESEDEDVMEPRRDFVEECRDASANSEHS